MRVVKAVRQSYCPGTEALELLEDFRLMVNDCIRIGLKENITSMRRLSLASYHALAEYPGATCYRLTATSRAAGILRTYRKSLGKNPQTKMPHAKRPMLTDCYGFRMQGDRLRLTLRAHEHIHIDLDPHTLAAIQGCTVRSVTLTPKALSIAYSKEVEEIEPRGVIGIDRNLDNITTASSDATIQTLDMSKAPKIKEAYREVKSHLMRNDVRIRRRVFGKYGTLQRDRVGWILSNDSSSIVKQAKEKRFGIVMEDLKGLRRLYRKGNGQGSDYRARLNSWSYYELQRQIEYKARWEGIPVVYVAARGTSVTCSTCGSRTCPNERRGLYCAKCGTTVDRDVSAARNILAKGALRFGANGRPGEAMVAERGRREATLIRTVDGGKSVHALNASEPESTGPCIALPSSRTP
jgi:putative transposase